MQVRIKNTGAVIYESEFRAMHPDTSFPMQIDEATLNAFGADVVFEGPQAQPTRYQIAYIDGVEQDEQGRWFTKYFIADMDADAIASTDAEQAKQIRATRNNKLKECDWTQVLDAPINQTVWAAYRQELRDISLQDNFPYDIIWPTQPG